MISHIPRHSLPPIGVTHPGLRNDGPHPVGVWVPSRESFGVDVVPDPRVVERRATTDSDGRPAMPRDGEWGKGREQFSSSSAQSNSSWCGFGVRRDETTA